MKLRVLVMALVCVLGFAGGFLFDRWLHRPIAASVGHRPAYHMEWI
jgi:hypothetical protein